jgi:hypothetical protein
LITYFIKSKTEGNTGAHVTFRVNFSTFFNVIL